MVSEPLQRKAFSSILSLAGMAALAALVGARGLGDPRGSAPLPQASAAAEQSAEPGACRLVAGPLAQRRESGRVMASSQIQNTGRQAATVHALQATWLGPFRLRQLSLGNQELPVDAAESPALVSLDDLDLQIPPDGRPVELSLIFEGDAGEDWKPGPTILLLREGCELAVLGPEPQACPLQVEGPQLDEAEAGLLHYQLRNAGGDPASLTALELDWPAADNGPLVGLALTGEGLPEAPLRFESPIQRPPAVLSLQRSFGRPITLRGDAEARLSARFAGPIAERGYALTLLDASGCRSSRTSWLDAPSCSTELRGLKLSQRSASALLANSQGITQTLASLDVIWQPAYQGALVDLMVDGASVQPRPISASPASIPIAPGLPVGPGQAVEVKLVFGSLDPETGAADPPAEQDDRPRNPLGGGDLSLVARFRGGCQAVATTLSGEADLGCRITAGELLREEGSPEPAASVRLSNGGAEARLTRISASWPVHNGDLTGLTLGSRRLIDPPVPPASTPVDLALLEQPLVGRGETQDLRLDFARSAARGGYSLVLGFDQASGERCDDLVLTSPAVAIDCDLVLSEPRVLPDARTVEMSLLSQGQDPLELESLRLAWAVDGGMSTMRLRGLSLVYDGEQEVKLLAQANQSTPVHVRVADVASQPVTLSPGQRATLQLVFDEIRSPADLVRTLKASLGFVEGCAVAYPPGGNVIGPQRIKLEARIEKLPEDGGGIHGAWHVRELERDLPWVITVDRGTQFEPSNIRPRLGDTVRIEAQLLETVNLAERITFLVRRPERKFLGLLDAVEPAIPPALPPAIEVDGRRVELVEGFTVVDRPQALVVGATVLVQGSLGVDGRFMAARVEVLHGVEDAAEPVAFRGIVQDVRAAAGQSPFPDVRDILIVDQYEVHVPDTLAARLPRPAAGQPVEVEGLRIGVLVRAESLHALPTPAAPRQVEGRILALPPGSLLGTWTIDLGQPGATRVYSFTVASVALVDERRAPAAPGMRVEATVRLGADGQARAVRVRTDWP